MMQENGELIPPDHSKGGLRNFAVVLGVICVVVAGAWWITQRNDSSSKPPRMYEVVYAVDGTAASADLTLETANGGTSQQAGVTLPVMNKNGETGLHLRVPEGAYLYISAQNNSESGTVTCHILLEGVEVVANTSSGAYVIATCSGHV